MDVRRPPAAGPGDRGTVVLLALALCAAVALTFWPVRANGFVELDDRQYVLDNPVVLGGLDLAGIRRAFGEVQAGFWLPLTWLSYMLDVRLFGLDAGAHHLMSVAIHAAAALACFAFLRSATGRAGRSFVVALLFAIHPTRLESVAWAAERKDVLCGLFGFLALWAWSLHVHRPSHLRFAATAILYTAGLLSKPMLVSFPLLLLLLDVWPFRRWPGAGARWRGCLTLVIEKIPFALLAAATAVIAMVTQTNAMEPMSSLDFGVRLGNAVVSVVQYARQLAWPATLSIFYPHPGTGLSVVAVLTSAALVAAASVLSWHERHRRPWIWVGWLWFLGSLLPVLGLVQVGMQARADRFLYLPGVGLLIAAIWTVADTLARLRYGRAIGVAATVVLATAAALRTRAEIPYWHDAITICQRAVDVSGDRGLARFTLAWALRTSGRATEAIPHFQAALVEGPTLPVVLDQGAQALFQAGRPDEAAAWLQELVRREPAYGIAHYNLGELRLLQGELQEGAESLAAAARCGLRQPRLYHDLGTALLLQGELAAGAEWLRQATSMAPERADWRAHLEGALALRRGERTSPAAAKLRLFLADCLAQLAEARSARGDSAAAQRQLKAVRSWLAPDLSAATDRGGPPRSGSPVLGGSLAAGPGRR